VAPLLARCALTARTAYLSSTLPAYLHPWLTRAAHHAARHGTCGSRLVRWMTSIFAVPRALIYWKRDHAKTGEFGPLGDLTYRLYRFSAGLMVIALLTGIYLGAAVFQFAPWVLVKLGLVVLLGGHYMMTGGMVMRANRLSRA